MIPSNQPAANASERATAVHREILQLAALIAIAAAAFFLTRAVAANNREMNVRDAAEWYVRGQRALANGSVDGAIEALRRATVKDRGNKRYVLALARALAQKKQEAAAGAALLALRESFPDDPEVNLELARLAAGRHDVTEASRYYHNALYSPWTAEQGDARRSVRIELIRFLLEHDQRSRALSEILALAIDVPEDAGAHVLVARLLSQAGDPRRALDQYMDALRLDPTNEEALAGAGEAAFQQGDYALARRYLHRVHTDTGHVAETRQIADLVLSADPLGRRISVTERRRRLIADWAYAKQRWRTCAGAISSGASPVDQLADEIASFEAGLRPSAMVDSDTIEAGVELIHRIERTSVQRCKALPMDDALLLIGRLHGADDR